jgi:Protein of unknown function (DUF2778)
VGEILVGLGFRAVPFGIAAVVLGFGLKSLGTQASPADVGLRGSSLSVFGTIHPDIFRLPEPIGSALPPDRVRLASLGPEVGSDALAIRQDMLTDPLVSARRRVSVNEPPASFDNRFASVDDYPASSEESLGSAMRQLASSLRSPKDRDAETAGRPKDQLAYAPPNEGVQEAGSPSDQQADAVSNTAVPSDQLSNSSATPTDDDSRTAIYDITAHAVYMPGGRKLEAHSGIGELMDNPRHVRVRMRGATPPNTYKLSLRGQLFHGVRALRLTPLDERKMYGRDGMLAHSYLLRAKGQSHGCVVFSNYPEFLNAFLKGDVTRLVVVERLDSLPSSKIASGSLPDNVKDRSKAPDHNRLYAAAGAH